MGKKVFSLCMALALCLVLLPAAALAADGATVYGTSERGAAQAVDEDTR